MPSGKTETLEEKRLTCGELAPKVERSTATTLDSHSMNALSSRRSPAPSSSDSTLIASVARNFPHSPRVCHWEECRSIDHGGQDHSHLVRPLRPVEPVERRRHWLGPLSLGHGSPTSRHECTETRRQGFWIEQLKRPQERHMALSARCTTVHGPIVVREISTAPVSPARRGSPMGAWRCDTRVADAGST